MGNGPATKGAAGTGMRGRREGARGGAPSPDGQNTGMMSCISTSEISWPVIPTSGMAGNGMS